MDELYPCDLSLGEIVEAQAARAPFAPAVVFGSECLGYDALNRRANRLARHLCTVGIGPGGRVATFLDRSADMVVAWLAILKVGAAYVPLDPDYPRERLRFMLEDSGATAVVTTARDRRLLPPGPTVVSLDEERDAIAAHADANLSCDATGASLAHVIYTSGSTGQPKGVCIPQRAVSRLVLDTTWFTFEPSDRLAQAANASFDATSLEVWGALLNGACVVGVPRDVVLAPVDLARFLREQQITVIFLTTALFNAVVGADARAFAGVRALFTGGEAMNARCARDVVAAGPPEQFMNVYGPTENGIFSTFYIIHEVPLDAVSVPIGGPVDRTDLCVLDESFQPVTPGTPGELCTGGDGLADGYWNRPEMTASRFIPHPSGTRAGARLYRTGDRVRQLPDGAIEFLGRLDQQVKIRGHRIEPGEIDAVLVQHPAVAEAAVVAREDRPGEKRLVAYVQSAGKARLGVAELRGFVADRLPAYMLPSAFVVLDEMPLTPSGKIDRRALPPPPASRASSSEYVAPRTPVEEALTALWASLTGVAEVGVDDDFFELGGHSLLAAQVVARINESFGTTLPISTIFEQPTVASIAERLAAADRADRPAVVPLTKAPRGGPLPLSYSQETVWFMNELEPGNLAYNFQASIRFTGALDVPALQRTLEEIVRRHEIFRTAFVKVGDQPAQVIRDPMPLRLPLLDLRHLSDDERRPVVERLFREQFKKPFDLERPPLVRWTLLRTGDEDYELIHVEHHIVHDGWSFAVLLREMKTLYEAFSRGEPSPLADPEWQFADYTCWQRQSLEGGALDEQLAFWRRYLAGAPPVLDLPTDHPRPDAVSFRGGCERIDMPTDLYAAMRTFSRQEKVTLFMTMAAAFQALLWRYTGEEDMVLGTAMADRPRREFESVMGMFVNPVLMRTDLSGNPTFHELVQRVRGVALDAYAHQETPIFKLVEALQPERDRSRNPLFQVLFSFHDAAVPELAFDRVTGTIIERQNGSAKFDLNIICIPRVEQRAGDGHVSEEVGLTLLWEYNADLFERATAIRLYDEYQAVLRAATADPGLRLGDLPFLSPGDRRRVLVEWNETPTGAAEPQALHALFEAQARRTPDATAIELEGEPLTYRELNRRANQLAHRLRRAGAGSATLVGIVAERSLEMVAAILGVLKAGAAYVPIDPGHPAERVALMLADAGVPLLLTQEHLAADLPPHGAQVIAIDREWNGFAGEADHDPAGGAAADSLACVMFTSGSTGTPKGVMVTHANVARLFTSTDESFQFGDTDVWTLFHSYGSALSLWETWGALLHGARLVVVPTLTARSPENFYALVCREGVTILNQTPTAFRQLIAAQAATKAAHRLRHVMLGGETLDAATLKRWYERDLNGGTRLTNLYALTEAAGPVACAALEQADTTRRGGGPASRRVPDVRVYVLDPQGEPVPVGVTGELYVGGACVGRGYLNRPALSEECFLADPFSPEPGARMFRTGDLGRRLADGTLECLGRIGSQVRIRGLRIDEGAIAAHVAGQPGVADAVVMARDDAAGEKQLVAYYVCDPPGADVTAEGLRTELARALPAYMVPAAYVRVESLPVTPHATLDRQALPAPDFIDSEQAYVAPRTELEAQIAEIWRQVLGVERVGARDYFFDLGGHSLKTLQIRSRLSQELGVDLSLRAAFDHPTVEQQAQLISARGPAAPAAAASLTIPRLADAPYYPLSHAQRRLWFLHRLDPNDAYYNRPIRVALRGRLDEAALRRAFDGLVARHDTLRTQFSIVDDEPVQTIVDDFRAAIERHDLSATDDPVRRQADLQSLLIRLESAPFTLDTPPVRAVLCRLNDESHVFVMVLHHIAFDGWSGEVLLDDLASLYAAECGGVQPELAPLPVRYVDYAAWQQAQASSGALKEDEEHWVRQLGGELPQLEVGTDPAGDRGSENTTHVEVVECSAADAERLDAVARERGVTTFVLRTAILQTFLARFTGRTDVLIGAPAAGRTQPELERLVGFFVNTLPLRTGFAGNPRFEDVVERVRQTVLDAYVHEAYPFDLLVERLNPVRDADRLPLLQALFTVEGNLYTRAVEGLTLETMPDLAIDIAVAGGAAGRTGKLDLSVSCLEKPDGRLAWVFLLDGQRISKTSARRLAVAFQTFHAALVEGPGRRLSDLPVLPADERHRVLTEWNATDLPYQVACIHELFEAQVRRTPNAIAAVCGADRLTFAELDRRANWVAHRLRAMGAGPEALVGLYVERTLDMLIALLATWKAGAACLPLDPKYPRARLEWMLADAGASVVLTDRSLHGRVPTLAGVEVWPLEAVWRDAASSAELPPASGVTPRHLAYVIYTSGSTGTPKGVAVEHASVCAFVHHMREMFTPEERAASVAATSICFDFWVSEMLTPLAWGGTVILVESVLHVPSMSPSVPATMMCGVPSAIAELVRDRALPPSLRVAAIGGEPVSNRLVQQVYAHGAARVFNVYGPTEATCFSTLMPVTRGATADPPIGRPVANAKTYVLDAELEPVAPGVVGELYIGGAGLVRGYYGRPDLTADRFVPNPFGPEGGRLYRTGDRVRHGEAGALEFVGRCDDQVKLRGYRVELGEIETALLEHGTLREAVAIVREDTPGEKSLVAYVTPSEGRPSSPSADADDARALQRFLHAKLPAYMVPSAIVILESVPRQPNGKVNRAALPAPAASVDVERVEPRTDLERAIAAVWSDVLGTGPIGIDDNVYELGAHSLMATKVHRRVQDLLVVRWAGAGAGAPPALAARIQRQVREMVAQEFPLRAVFDHPTVRTLAASVNGGADDPTEPSDPDGGSRRDDAQHGRVEDHATAGPPLTAADVTCAGGVQPVAAPASYPVSHAQRRIWLLHRLDPTGGAYNIVYSLRLVGRLDAAALERALRQVLERHEALRTTIGLDADGGLVQRIQPRLDLPWAVRDWSSLPEEAREARVRERLMHAAREPFDLESGPLVRAELARLGEGEHRLLVAIHHVVLDGRAWDVIFDELATAYAAISSGATPAFAAPGLRYVDYAAWQNARLADGGLAAAEEYWRARFTGGIPELALPVDHPNPPTRKYHRHRHVVVLDRGTSDRLRAIAQHAKTTPFIVNLSIVAAFLRRMTGQDDLVVGSPVAGRDHPDADRTVGCFINTVLLRTTVSGDPKFTDVIAAVRTDAIDAYQHQDYPLDLLVQKLGVARDGERASLVQVLFATAGSQQPRVAGAVEFSVETAADVLGLETDAALPSKFDFHMAAYDEPDGRLTWLLGFDTDLFEAATARRLTRRFEAFVADLTRRPDANLSALAFLTGDEDEALRLRRAAGRTQYPPTFNQREMWVQCQLRTGNGLNNIGVEVALTGPLDVDSFQDAFQAVVDRHEALRTIFEAPDGAPVQRVQRVCARAVVRDLSGVPAAEQGDLVRARRDELAQATFALDQAPLFRAELLRLDERRSVFIFVVHHLVLDGYYLSQFLDEIAGVYTRYTAGDRSPLVPAPLQYGDFAVREEQVLEAGLLAQHQSYWRAQLRTPLPAMAIPAHKQPPTTRTFENGYVIRRLSPDVTAALKDLVHRHRTTLYCCVAAAYDVWVWRMTGETDLLIAMPFSTRPNELRDVVGFFANTLPLRRELDVEQPFTALLVGVADQFREARSRREFPLTEAMRSLDLQRDPNRPALPICISQVRAFAGRAGELEFNGTAPFARSTWDMWLLTSETDEGLELNLTYAAELFEHSAVESWADALVTLLAAAGANPDVPLRALPLVSGAGEHRLRALGDGGPGAAAAESVGVELAAVASRTPDAVAVVSGAERWTYADLQAAAARAAAALRASGVGREDRVGILGTRSPGMLASVIGVLQAGAAFVPLEASQPDARLQTIVLAAGVTAVVADRESFGRAKALVAGITPAVRVISWDDLGAGQPSTRPAPLVANEPTDLAYIFYTSGSTGTPKGAMVEQRGMRNHLRAKIETLGLDATSVVAQTASYGFDIVVWQWLAPLLAGGRVVIYDDATAYDPAGLVAALARDGVTVVETVPSFLEAMTAVEGAPPLPSLRWMVSNAEALPPAVAARWYARHPATRLLNTCGATECSDDTTHGEVSAALSGDVLRVTVGGPIPGSTTAVVDDLLRPVPRGCVGEIAYGGVVVGRGYLGDPVTTAQAFVPDPLSPVPGARMYRTGDRGRWRDDGELECLGRLDDQVKVHGYRVELGEVEAALASVPELSQSAAAVRADARGQHRLVAYYVAPSACDEGAARAALAARLPPYMVPSVFMRLSALPRTRTGKLDRAALPAPAAAAEPAAAPEAAATPVETALAAVWQQVLQVPFVGRHDNFFDLGGDSIQSILVASRLTQRGFRVSPRAVFAHQTIAELARVVEQSERPRADEQALAPPAPVLPIQQSFFDQRMVDPHHWNQAVILAPASSDERVLRRAVQAVVDGHAALRTRFFERDGRWLQQASPAGEPAVFDVIDLDAAGEPLEAASTRVQSSLDYERGPVFRAALIRKSGDGDRLLLAAHHLVIDTVSWGVLIEDLGHACAQAAAGEPASLVPEATTYAQWVHALSNPSDRFDGELPYWQSVVQRTRPVPRDHDLGPNTAASVDRVRGSVAPETTRRLLTGARRALQADTLDLLLCAFARAAGPWTGARDVTVYLEGHGREDLAPGVDLGRTIGWFTAAYPVCLDTRALDLAAHVTRVRDGLRQVPSFGIGYSFLRWASRQLASARAPEISFNYHGQVGRLIASDRFTLTRESAGEATSARNDRAGLVDVECAVVGGRLEVEVLYSANVHRRETMGRLLDSFVAELGRVATLCDGTLLPAEAEEAYPLAPIQEGMLFHALFEPESSLYYEQAHAALEGPLDVDALRGAWTHLFASHPILRTVIRWEGLQEPVQVVLAPSPAPLQVVDLRHLTPEQQESHLARDADEQWAERFSLDRGPLVRLTLFVLGADRFRLVWSFHHILLDGWSVSTLLREVAGAYEALVEHKPLRMSPARPYRDFVAWLRKQDRAAALDFWRRQLAGFESATPLPRDRSKPVTRRREAGHAGLALGSDLTRALDRWTRAERVTMSALLRTAWAILLARLSGTTDVVFGATVSGRPAELGGVEQMVGPFINAVPARVVVDGAETAAALVGRVHAQSVEAGAFEYLPLPELQKACGIPADRPLFDSLFAYENYPEGRPQSMAGVRMRNVAGRELTHYDLTLVAETTDTLRLRLSYAADVYERATAERIVGALANLLGAIAADPQALVSNVSFMSKDDAALVAAWSDGGPGIEPTDRSIAADVLAVAARTPHAVAVVSGEERWTYAQVCAAAGRMGAALRAAGVGREGRVAVLGTRSPRMIATVVGVTHAGAAFVPIEANQPDARIRSIVQRAAPAVIVTDRATLQRVRRLAAALTPPPAVLCWDEIAVASGEAAATPPAVVGPSDLAYILFTSGSTGTPKGVMVEQRGMRNHIRAKTDLVDLNATSVLVQNSSCSFDIIVWQMLAPLLVGGRVVIYDTGTATDGPELLAALARDAVTVVELVPSVIKDLLAAAEGPGASSLPALRWMVSNAEPLAAAVVARWHARYPSVRMANCYGLTECSDDITHVELFASHGSAARVPVGRPIAGSTVTVVDERLRPVPPGCVGELVVGGVPVARGYLDDPVATARAFVPDPNSTVAGARLYRAGDRGRWRTDGLLECLGRRDDQVKVHGYRVELGEVESALATLPELSQAAAAVRTDARGEQHLVAYYVAPVACEVTAVRTALAARLPAHMVPDAFVRLEALPLTLTGKLDRGALPTPHSLETAPAAAEPPLTPLEATVAAVWQHVLQVPHVGRNDTFFDLGGHSLTAIRIVAALKERLGRHVPIWQLFMTPALGEFAAAIQDAPADSAPALARVADRPWYPVSSAQRVQWIVQQLNPGPTFHPPRVLQLDGELDRGALGSALQGLCARHDMLRATFAERDGDVVQVVQERFDMPYAFDDVSELAADDRAAWLRATLQADTKRPFDLSRLPLLNVRLVRLEASRHLLLLRLPHIISDGWTEGILVTDLAELYDAHRTGRAPSLPPLGVRYVDVAAREKEWLASQALQSQKAYWLERFSGDVPALKVPTDVVAGSGGERRVAFATALVDEETISALRATATANGATFFAALLGAFEVLLARVSGQSDVVVGTTVAGRGQPELERVAGVFANMLPLRTSLSGNPRFTDVLRRVSDTTLAAMARQDYPFQLWIDELRRRRAQHDLRLFSAFFVVHEEAFSPAFDGLTARWFSTDAFGNTFERRSLQLDQRQQLMFAANDTGRGWRIALLGDAAMFTEGALEHLLEQWTAIVRQVSAEPERRFADIDLPVRAGAELESAIAGVALDRDELDYLFA